MHVRKLAQGGYIVALNDTEYAVVGAALEEAQSVVNGSPSQDAEEEKLTTLVNNMTKHWEIAR